MTASRCPVREGFDPLAPEFLADPYAVLASLPLDEAPLFYAPSIGYYVLTRYADIEQVFRDPATFSAAAAQARWYPWCPRPPRSCWPAGTGRSRPWSAWTSPRTPGCASPRPARSA